MSSQLEQESPPDAMSMTSIVRGIVQDAQDLLQQQIRLLQVEVKNDARRTLRAAVMLIAGIMVAFIALVILAITAAEALAWAWPAVPLWGAYAIVGGVLAVIGVGAILAGKARFQSFNPLPNQTLEGLKENLQWKTKP